MAVPHPSLALPCHIMSAHPGCECTHQLLSDGDLPSTITVWGDIASEQLEAGQPVIMRARRPALQHVLSDTGYDHVTGRYYTGYDHVTDRYYTGYDHVTDRYYTGYDHVTDRYYVTCVAMLVPDQECMNCRRRQRSVQLRKASVVEYLIAMTIFGRVAHLTVATHACRV